ncbi:MAG TPA: homocysteine S-methyltransferase family protein [Candidatus Omnitrophota bacterium]|nr:homocysteine S-methyltransferase family protein [Candidatus Omnitrophota bacterium]
MSDLLERLRRGPCLLLDGGFGSELIARGLEAGASPDRWTLERPADVLGVHRAYVEAGTDAIHANTFGANRARLERYGLAGRIEEINHAAVRLAREAGARYVFADIGPSGEHLPPVGRGTPDEWRRVFEEQGRILAGTDVDAFHVETMTDLREGLAALESLRRAAPGIPVLVSLTFERKKRGFFTLMGDPIAGSLARLRDAGAAVVGANCTLASGDLRDLAREALASTDALLAFQPNAGMPALAGGRTTYAQSPSEFAEDLAPLAIAPRVAALGGCCGTDPRFIRALRARMSRPAAVPA